MRSLKLIAVAALAFSLAGGASAQSLDKAGKCRDAKGHFATMAVCKAVKKPVCRDAKGKFAKCGTAGAMSAKK